MVYPTWAVGLAGSIVAVIVLLGIFGNMFVIAIIFKTKQLKGKGHALIANLAVADTLQSVNLIFMLVAVANGGTWILSEAACQLHAYLTVEFVLASMLTLCAVSVNRYFLIVRPRQYDTFFCPKIMRLIVVLIWLLPQIFAILPIFGWSRFVFQPGKSLCLFKFSFSKSYAFTLVSTITTLPLVVILVAYYKIFRTVGQHVERTKKTLKPQGHGTTANVDEIQITRTLAVVIGSYVVCFLPATVINFVEMFKPDWDIPVWLDLSSMVLVMANHANNPLIYGLMNRQYRMAFVRLAKGVFGKSDQRAEVSSHFSSSQCSTAQEAHVSLSKGGVKLDMPDANEISVLAPGKKSKFTALKV